MLFKPFTSTMLDHKVGSFTLLHAHIECKDVSISSPLKNLYEELLIKIIPLPINLLHATLMYCVYHIF